MRRCLLATVLLIASITIVECGDGSTKFFTFDYEDGNPDPTYWDNNPTNGAGGQITIPMVKNGQLCADVQAITVYIGNPRVGGATGPTTINMVYNYEDISGAEGYVVAIAQSDISSGTLGLQTPLYIIGVDGGGPSLVIRAANSSLPYPAATSVPLSGLSANTNYRITAFIADNYIKVTLYGPNAEHIAENFLSIQNSGLVFHHYGLLTGRTADGKLTCAQSWSIKTTTSTVNRFATSTGFFSVASLIPFPTYSTGQFCADDHAIAVLDTDFGGTTRVSFTFTSAGIQGFQVMHIGWAVSSTDTNTLVSDPYMFIVGLDGGSQSLTIRPFNNSNPYSLADSGQLSLTPGDTYHLISYWSQYGIVVELRDASGSLTARVGASTRSFGFSAGSKTPWQRFGFMVGRTVDSLLTCAYNFIVETNIDPVSPFFVDNFNRVDASTLGSNYVTLGSGPNLAVSNKEACADIQAIALTQNLGITTPWLADFFWTGGQSVDNWEAYAYSTDSSSAPTIIGFAGVDGGDNTRRLSFGNDPADLPNLVLTEKLVLDTTYYQKTNDKYYHTVSYSSNHYFTVDILSIDDAELIGTYVYRNSYPTNFQVPGIQTGRQANSLLSCIDNYVIQTQPLNPAPTDNQNGGSPTCNSNGGGKGGTTVLYFTYNDGPPDPAYWNNYPAGDAGGELTPLNVVNNQLCSDIHALAFYIGDGTTAGTCGPVLIDMTFTFEDATNDVEAYIVALASSTFPTDGSLDIVSQSKPVYIAGLDGGSGPALVIRPVNSTLTNGVVLPASTYLNLHGIVSFVAGNVYRLTAAFRDNYITVELHDSAGVLLANHFLDITNSNLQFHYYGMVLGRDADSKLTCASSFSIKSTSSYTDNFNRVSFGNNWALPNTGGAAIPAAIVGNQVCGDTQAVVMNTQPFNGTVRISFTMTAASSTGLEANIIAADITSISNNEMLLNDPNIIIAGLDGGGPDLSIKNISLSSSLASSATLTSLVAGNVYHIIAFFSQFGIDVQIIDPTNPTAPPNHIYTSMRQFSHGVDNPFHIYGVVVGRTSDNLLTCIDNWSVEYNIDPVSVADVYDNFNRVSLGPGLSAPGGSLTFQANEICADVQTPAFSTMTFTTPVTVDYYYTAADPNDWESYAIGVALGTTTNQSNIALCGMDSGVTLRASYADLTYTHISVSDLQMPKTVDIFYHIVAFLSNSVLAVDLRTFDDRIIASNSFDLSSAGVDLQNFGLLVGRTSNSKLTCADNMAIQIQPLKTYTPVSSSGGGTGDMNTGHQLVSLSAGLFTLLVGLWVAMCA